MQSRRKHLHPEIVVRLLESVDLAQERFPRQVAHWAGGAGKSDVVTVLRPRLTHVQTSKKYTEQVRVRIKKLVS